MRRTRPARAWLATLLVGLSLTGCRTSQPAIETESLPPYRVSYTVVSDSLPEDPALEALVAPYRARLQEQVAEVIGTAAAPLTKGQPEGTLGNMAAEAMLEAGQALEDVRGDAPVEMAVTNNGGLRIPLPAGPITVGLIYELMPFENTLAVLTLSGVQVDTLAQQIARVGGEPIAGFSFKILGDTHRAVDVQVQGRPLDHAARYRLVTSDYLAAGGGNMPVLWEPLARDPSPVLLRDAIIAYVRRHQTVDPVFDGRISLVEGEAYLRP